uniref:DIRP domain-containing protein n=1 Tax=Dracunculus medinensis TaxID=318479 RepID=A0A158Q538_DRAME
LIFWQSDKSDKKSNIFICFEARRWVYCEFFYSGVDQQLFLGDSDFITLVHDAFPNLRCKKLRRPEWRVIRKCIGKPRRFSQAFLDEERIALQTKRYFLPLLQIKRIEICSIVDLPDGIYAGTIDAVLPDSYRVVFDKEEMIPPMIVKDYEVMSEQKVELLPLNYFLEQNRAAVPTAYMKYGTTTPHFLNDVFKLKVIYLVRDEKVGNFPVRMLVVLVKLSKLIDAKKKLVRQITDLNTEAEKMNLFSDCYPLAFQEKYAIVCMDLEALNKQMHSYLQVSLISRPEALRKLCHTHAVQIVKHCNNGLNVQNKRCISLITSLAGLLLQIRALCQQKCTPLDLQTLSESLCNIRKHIYPSNRAAFQDYVEIHLKEVNFIMLNGGKNNAPRH